MDIQRTTFALRSASRPQPPAARPQAKWNPALKGYTPAEPGRAPLSSPTQFGPIEESDGGDVYSQGFYA